jgi:hypothetical protein
MRGGKAHGFSPFRSVLFSPWADFNEPVQWIGGITPVMESSNIENESNIHETGKYIIHGDWACQGRIHLLVAPHHGRSPLTVTTLEDERLLACASMVRLLWTTGGL